MAQFSAELDLSAKALAGPGASVEHQGTARELLIAEVVLTRIRVVRAEILQEKGTPESKRLRDLAELDGYERFALARSASERENLIESLINKSDSRMKKR